MSGIKGEKKVVTLFLEVQLSRRKEEEDLELWKLFVTAASGNEKTWEDSEKGGFKQLLPESGHC